MVLKEIHLTQRVSIWNMLFNQNPNDLFLEKIVIADENQILCKSVQHKGGEPAEKTSEGDIHEDFTVSMMAL